MVGQHLHVLHLRSTHVLAGHRVVAAHQVHPLDVEIVDGLALITDRAVLADLQSRHLGNHVGDRAVLLVAESRYAVGQRVALSAQPFRGGLHLLQLQGLLPHPHLLAVAEVGSGDGLLGVTEDGECQVGGRLALGHLQFEAAVLFRAGEGHGLVPLVLSHHAGPSKTLSALGDHPARVDRLAPGTDRHRQQQ